jgi:integrase
MRRAGAIKPHKRAGIWYLVRRVPKEFSHLDTREIVRLSTEIAVADDPRAIRATQRVQSLNVELEAYWRGLRDGQSVEARRRFEAARKRALDLGFVYQSVDELAAGKQSDLVARIESLLDRRAVDNEVEVAALLGGEGKPQLMVSDLVKEYEAIIETELAAKSPDQLRRWRNPKKRAMDNFIEVVGDKALADLTRNDALTFRKWWADRIADDDLKISTANKDFGHLQKMFTTIEMAHQVQFKPVFARLRFGGEDRDKRSAFDPKFIQGEILADGALDGLNSDARCIIYLIVETGIRLSEACNLLPEHIHLDAPVPYIHVTAGDRELKTPWSDRTMPLVGVALMAMQEHPEGFERYRDKGASFSAMANKFLKGHGLLPTDNHSVYSLRHSFEDRLTAVEPPEKIMAVLMGHKYNRPRYGEGPTLEQKQRWLQKIAFTPPAHV